MSATAYSIFMRRYFTALRKAQQVTVEFNWPVCACQQHFIVATLLTAFLGFALHMARRTAESRQTMSTVLTMPCHPHAYAMAQDMLGLKTPNTLLTSIQEPLT